MMETEMAESAMDMDLREEEIELSEGEKEENIDGSNTSSTNTSEFLKELNLVLILSFLSLSAEERLNCEEIKPKEAIKHPKSKHNISTLHVNKRETKVNEFRALDRQTQKFQTKIRDCRHCRRI